MFGSMATTVCRNSVLAGIEVRQGSRPSGCPRPRRRSWLRDGSAEPLDPKSRGFFMSIRAVRLPSGGYKTRWSPGRFCRALRFPPFMFDSGIPAMPTQASIPIPPFWHPYKAPQLTARDCENRAGIDRELLRGKERGELHRSTGPNTSDGRAIDATTRDRAS